MILEGIYHNSKYKKKATSAILQKGNATKRFDCCNFC